MQVRPSRTENLADGPTPRKVYRATDSPPSTLSRRKASRPGLAEAPEEHHGRQRVRREHARDRHAPARLGARQKRRALLASASCEPVPQDRDDLVERHLFQAEELGLAHRLRREHLQPLDGRAFRGARGPDRRCLPSVATVDAVEDDRLRLQEARRNRRRILVPPADRGGVDVEVGLARRAGRLQAIESTFIASASLSASASRRAVTETS